MAALVLENAQGVIMHITKVQAVGRQSHSWLRELVQHHVADELVRKGEGFTIWVVE